MATTSAAGAALPSPGDPLSKPRLVLGMGGGKKEGKTENGGGGGVGAGVHV